MSRTIWRRPPISPTSAVFLETLPISPENGKGPGVNLAPGKEIYDRDCAECHGKNGEGSAEKFYPMVAAQHYRYLLRELRFIRDGDRGNSNPDMVKVIKSYRDAQLEALADYMAQMSRRPGSSSPGNVRTAVLHDSASLIALVVLALPGIAVARMTRGRRAKTVPPIAPNAVPATSPFRPRC